MQYKGSFIETCLLKDCLFKMTFALDRKLVFQHNPKI